MNKWLKVMAVTSSLLPFAVMADSDIGGAGHSHAGSGAVDHHTMHDGTTDKSWEFYGALYMALQNNDPGSAPDHDGNEPASNLWLTSEGTTIGFRGAIPLDSGLKAVWQIESIINLDEFGEPPAGGHSHGEEPANYNDSELAGGHNSFIGLSGNYGTILAGKHNTPFFDAVIQFDLFHHLAGDVRATLGRIPGVDSGTNDHHGGTFNVSAGDTIMYKSPNWNGFAFEAAMFGLNERRTEVGNKSSAFGVGARYSQEMFTLVGAYEMHNNFDLQEDDAATAGVDESTQETIDETSAFVIGGMLHFNDGNTMVGGFYEQLDTSDSNRNVAGSTLFTTDSRTGYYVNFQQRFLGNNKFKAAYAIADDFASHDGGTSLTVGLAHELGPKTEVYGSFTTVDNDEEGDYSTGSIGPLEHGSDPKTLAFGLIHTF